MLTIEQQQRDRTTTFGGSEMPILMGDSKFTTAWQLLMDKAGIEPLPYVANMYASLGNILEPVVQDKMKTTNMDEHEYKNENYYLPVVGHIDGVRKSETLETLIEIKVSSASLEDAYKQYRAQIQMYLHLTGHKKAELHLLNRNNDKIKPLWDNVRLRHFKLKDWQLAYASEKQQELIEQELALEFESLKIAKKDVLVKKVKYDVNYQLEIDEKINTFCKYLEMIHEDPFIDLAQLKVEFEREMNGQHELVEYDTTTIEKLEVQIKAMKEIEKQYKAEKEKLLTFMQDNDIKKIDNDKFSITRKAGYTSISIDTKKLKEEEPELQKELINKYEKVKVTKESLTVKIKEKKNEILER